MGLKSHKLKKLLKCNKPQKSPNPKKKKVVKACEDDKEKLIHFGATGYKHNYSKDAKKNFRARHGCDKGKLSKLTAKYWSCVNLWGKTKKVGTK